MDPQAVAAAVRPDNPHLPRSRLLLLENTYGARGGTPLPPEYFAAMGQVARRHGLRVHLDGARLFNAAVALGRPAADLTRDADSVTFCLSKGLAAPVGSVLCGSGEFIHQATRTRKLVGGGMRQAGVLAAAGLVALEQMVDRLADDHAHAARLADGLAAVPGIRLDPAPVRTNIVFFEIEPRAGLSTADLSRRLADEHGFRVGPERGRRLRAVTHHGIGPENVDAFVAAVRAVLSRLEAAR